MKVCIYTLGCKVNQYESGGFERDLELRGIEVADKLCFADVYIINTCAVTAEAERKSRNSVTKCLAFNPNGKIFVVGCAVQKNAEQFIAKNNVAYVNGNSLKRQVLDFIDSVDVVPMSLEFEEYGSTKNSRTRAFVKVQDGCNNFCSYCIVPYLRGRSRSRDIEACVKEISELQDVKEVVLCGINLSDYKNGGLATLAEEVDKEGIRFRFGSLEVNVITEEFLHRMSKLANFCPQFHLSLQSGSSEVLKKMNRHYTALEYLTACNKIKETFVTANITTDVIVGFSGETDENFMESCELAQDVGFGDMHIFPYSKRQGTAAENLPDMEKAIKTQRVNILSKIRNQLKLEFIEKHKGAVFTVLTEELWENYTVGHTENFIKVYIQGEIKENSLVKCSIGSAFQDGALGELV